MKNTEDIEDVLCRMFDDGYYLCPQFAKTGMPDFYKDVFKDSCQLGRLTFRFAKSKWSLFRPVNSRW